MRRNILAKKRQKKRKKKKVMLTQKRVNRNISIGMFLLFFTLGSLALRVIHIALFKNEEYAKGVLVNMTQREREIQAPRGTIQDINGRTLAASVLAYDIILSPYEIVNNVREAEEKAEIYATLAKQLGKEASEIQREVEVRAAQATGNKYYMIAEKVNSETAEPLKELAGVTVSRTYIRNYPNNGLAAQVIGFYNKNGEGQYGVEEGYNDYLEGQAGRSFSQIQQYQIVTSELQEPVPGATVTLTIDSVVQKYVDSAMNRYVEKVKPKTATAIIMRPKTGEILSMYSYPSYNPNTYNNLSEQLGKSWANLSGQDQSTALLSAWKNNAIQLNYEPGSTFKPLVVAMALEEGVISKDKTYQCNGSKNVAGQVIKCWKREGHGPQTLSEALANSCNVALMDIGEEMDNKQFLSYIKNYGFGEKTGIELAGEEKGQLHHTLGPVEKATYCMGQTLTVTPIQLISAFSAVVNGGYLMEPYAVSEITAHDGSTLVRYEPTVKRQVISTNIANYVKEALKKVVDEGTGTNAAISGYEIGGKTGTGQEWINVGGKMIRDEEHYAISFMGFAPVDDPEIIGLVVFDGIPEGTGAQTLAFKEMMENIFPYLGIPTSTATDGVDNQTTTVPDLSGKTIYEAATALESRSLKCQILGAGKTVSEQYPKAGSSWEKEGTVTLYAKTDKPETLREVPHLIGKTIEEAKAMTKGHLGIQSSGSGKIVSQFPEAGYKIEAQSKIIVQASE